MRAKVPEISESGENLWRCGRCGLWKTEPEFSPDSRAVNHLTSHCKKCRVIVVRETRDEDNKRRLSREFMKRDRAKNPEKYRAIDRARVSDYRVIARKTLRMAVLSGKVEMPSKCSKCGLQKKLTGHHPDHHKPLEVEWVCYRCHGFITAEEKRNAKR